MAAHTPTDAAFVVPVQPDQPPSGTAAWLREMARGQNSVTGGLGAERAARIAGDQNLQDEIDALVVSGGGGITQLTGDVLAGPGSGSQVATLPNVNSSIGTFQGITLNAKGQATSASNQNYATSATVTAGDNLRVLKAGDTMTGPLVNSYTGPAPTLQIEGNFNQTLGTDTTWATLFGEPAMIVAIDGATKNALVGSIYNNAAPGAGTLPSAVTAFAKLGPAAQGNVVFATYSRAELYAIGGGVAVGHEITAGNYIGPPDTALPPNMGFGTTTNVANALQISATGTFDSAIGLWVGSEGGSVRQFNTATYLWAFRQYGLYIEAQAGGTQTNIHSRSNGNGPNIVLQTTGTAVPANEVLSVRDAAAAVKFSVVQGGDVAASGSFQSLFGGIFTRGSNASFVFAERDNASFQWTWYANATRARLTRSGAAADALSVGGGVVEVSTNTAALPTPPAGTLVHLGSVDATPTVLNLDSFGSTPTISGRRSAGTCIAPAVTASGNTLLALNGSGYDGAYTTGASAQIVLVAAGAWSAGDHSTIMRFSTTPAGSTTIAEAMRIDQAGNVGIGTPGATAKLHVSGNITGNFVGAFNNTHATAGDFCTFVAAGPAAADTATTLIQFYNSPITAALGAITRNGATGVTYGTTSDRRLKDEIVESDYGLDALMAIKVAEYRMQGDDRTQHGLLAQDVAEIYPEAVYVGGDDPDLHPWLIDYGRLTPLLIRTVQQQQAQIEKLEARLAVLE